MDQDKKLTELKFEKDKKNKAKRSARPTELPWQIKRVYVQKKEMIDFFS